MYIWSEIGCCYFFVFKSNFLFLDGRVDVLVLDGINVCFGLFVLEILSLVDFIIFILMSVYDVVVVVLLD